MLLQLYAIMQYIIAIVCCNSNNLIYMIFIFNKMGPFHIISEDSMSILMKHFRWIRLDKEDQMIGGHVQRT